MLLPQALARAEHFLRVPCTLAEEGKTPPPLGVSRAQRSAQAPAESFFFFGLSRVCSEADVVEREVMFWWGL